MSNINCKSRFKVINEDLVLQNSIRGAKFNFRANTPQFNGILKLAHYMP